MMTFSLGSSLVAIISGQVVARMGKYRPTVWFGFVSFFIIPNESCRIGFPSHAHAIRIGGYDFGIRTYDHGVYKSLHVLFQLSI